MLDARLYAPWSQKLRLVWYEIVLCSREHIVLYGVVSCYLHLILETIYLFIRKNPSISVINRNFSRIDNKIHRPDYAWSSVNAPHHTIPFLDIRHPLNYTIEYLKISTSYWNLSRFAHITRYTNSHYRIRRLLSGYWRTTASVHWWRWLSRK